MFDMTQDAGFVPLQQSLEFMKALQAFGVQVESVDMPGAVHGRAVLQSTWWPCLGWISLISRGPVWAGAADVQALVDGMRKQGHPVLVNAEEMAATELTRAGLLPVMTPSSVAIWDLSGGRDLRWTRMHQKWRNRLRRAKGGALTLRHGSLPANGNHWLLAREAAFRKARRYKGYPGVIAAHYAAENPDMARVFWAELEGQPVAGMVFLRHGAGATYFLGHSNELGRAHHAHNLLMAAAADWFAEHGTTVLDLGSLDTVNAPGLARFKLGCGARAHQLGGTWLYARRLAPIAKRLA